MIAIRKFAPADVAAVVRIELTAHQAGHWRAEDYQWLTRQPEGIVLVAELPENQAIAGFLAARTMGAEAEVLNLAVAEQYRRRGIGRRLVEDFHQRLCSMGTERVYLEVRPSNLTAQQLYRAIGYTECGRRPKYYASNGEGALVLEIRLGPTPQAGSVSSPAPEPDQPPDQ